MTTGTTKIPRRQKCVDKSHPYIGGAVDIIDDEKSKNQQQINKETDDTFALHQSEINALDSQNYESYTAASGQTLAQILPATGAVDTIYRVGKWDAAINGGAGGYDVTKYSEYAWDAARAQYKPMDVKDMQLGSAEDFENPDAAKREKIPTIGAVADIHGYYIENPEYINVLVDAVNHLLFWIKSDGSVDWSKGVPTPVKNWVNVIISFKVNKEEGRSLIDEDVADGIHYGHSPEFITATIDNEERLIEGIDASGKKYLAKPSNQDDTIQKQINDILIPKTTYSYKISRNDNLKKLEIQYPERLENSNNTYILSKTDSDGRLIFGIRKSDGKLVLPFGFVISNMVVEYNGEEFNIGVNEIDGVKYLILE